MLALDRVTVEFGGLRALDALDLAVGPGEVVGLIGPNGSGKTTVLNAIGGLLPLTQGEIRWQSRRIDGLPPHHIARLGIARALQHPRPYLRMTVAENLRAAWSGGDGDWHEPVQKTLALLELEAQRDVPAAELGLNDRRRLNLGQAIVRPPALLLLDEPAGGLAAEEIAAMAELLATRVLPGRAAIAVDHDVEMLSRLCGRFVALDAGRKIAEGPPSEVLAMPAVRQSLFGDA
jgi:ABC-type branched-subunit amino acid transport system ATPase component